jgi:hypothetical protein
MVTSCRVAEAYDVQADLGSTPPGEIHGSRSAADLEFEVGPGTLRATTRNDWRSRPLEVLTGLGEADLVAHRRQAAF